MYFTLVPTLQNCSNFLDQHKYGLTIGATILQYYSHILISDYLYVLFVITDII